MWIMFGAYLTLNISIHDKLESKGYTNKDISIIDDLLTKDEINTILDNAYLPYLSKLLFNKNYQNKHLSDYLCYHAKYKDITMDELLFMVNNNLNNVEYSPFIEELIVHNDYKKDLTLRYQTYHKKYDLNVDDTIYAVNHNLDTYDIKLNIDDKKYIIESYFIPNNLSRYKEFQKQNDKLTAHEIVESVNHNLDKKEYIDKEQADLNTPVVNHYYYLKSDYIPKDLMVIDKEYGNGKLNNEAYEAYKKMYDVASKENLQLYIVSGYISYDEQKKLYDSYVTKYGKSNADKKYERPGFSEQQTGLIITLGIKSDYKSQNFNKYKESSWMQKNAFKFGFILRYPEDKQKYTKISRNYQYRYVGLEIAQYIHDNNITLDEYYEYFIKNALIQ